VHWLTLKIEDAYGPECKTSVSCGENPQDIVHRVWSVVSLHGFQDPVEGNRAAETCS
jgi:hypothetical protein